MDKSIAKIEELGFRKIGRWFLKDGRLDLEIFTDSKKTNFLYAFVTVNYVGYIGKSTKTVKQRLDQYKKPGPSQKTNLRVNGLILALLSRSETIDIYVLEEKKDLYYGKYKLNLPAGLEDPLIFDLKPAWNKTGKK